MVSRVWLSTLPSNLSARATARRGVAEGRKLTPPAFSCFGSVNRERSFSSFHFFYLLPLQLTHATPFLLFCFFFFIFLLFCFCEPWRPIKLFFVSSSIATCRAMNFAGAGQIKSFGTFWKHNRMFSKHFWNVSETFECSGTLLKCFPIPKHLNVPEHFGTSEKF